MGPLIPLFWTSGDVSSGFQSQSGQPYSHSTEMYTFPEIHLWCDTCRPLGSQHGNQAILFHIPATCIGEARMEDLSHHRLSYAGSDPRGSTFPFACILIQMNPKAGVVRWYFKHLVVLSMTFYFKFPAPDSVTQHTVLTFGTTTPPGLIL